MHEYLRVSLHSRYHLGNRAIVAAEIRAARLTRPPPFPRGVSDGKIATMGLISVRACIDARLKKRRDAINARTRVVRQEATRRVSRASIGAVTSALKREYTVSCTARDYTG